MNGAIDRFHRRFLGDSLFRTVFFLMKKTSERSPYGRVYSLTLNRVDQGIPNATMIHGDGYVRMFGVSTTAATKIQSHERSLFSEPGGARQDHPGAVGRPSVGSR